MENLPDTMERIVRQLTYPTKERYMTHRIVFNGSMVGIKFSTMLAKI